MKNKITPIAMDKEDILPINPAICGFLRYNRDIVKNATPIRIILTANPLIPIIPINMCRLSLGI